MAVIEVTFTNGTKVTHELVESSTLTVGWTERTKTGEDGSPVFGEVPHSECYALDSVTKVELKSRPVKAAAA